ncbi:hypothetical protein BGZ73_004279 [Actinomortierella ambigua]|nr:hypothetical protein BGZ73_004279 [Actinomortierella ambigua]
MATLPLECIHAIVWNTCDLSTLYALLTVNRAVFKAAARRLWHNPLELIPQTHNWELAFERLAKFILSQAYPASSRFGQSTIKFPYTGMEEARSILFSYFELDRPAHTAAPAQTMLDYLSFIRAFADSPVLTSLGFKSGPPAKVLRNKMEIDYMEGLCYYQNEVIWAVCRSPHRLQQLTTLQIPLWRWNILNQYIGAVPQMKHLRHIVFDARIADHAGMTDEAGGDELLHWVLIFVETFVRHHGDRQLQRLDFLGGPYEPDDSEMTLELLSLVKEAVPFCSAPSSLGMLNWEDCLQNLEELDLGHVRSICLNSDMPLDGTLYDKVHACFLTLLRRCSSLEVLQGEVNREGLFNQSGVEHLADLNLQRTMMPNLRTVDITYPNGDFNSAVRYIMQTFGASLQVLNIRGALGEDRRPKTGGIIINTDPSVGLPQAKRILIDKGSAALVFHPQSLGLMPNLEILELSPERDVWYAHEDSLRASMDRIDKDEDISSMKDYQHLWSWDWSCPRLRNLRLGGEFAAGFHFKWLACCPHLQELLLFLEPRNYGLDGYRVEWFTHGEVQGSSGNILSEQPSSPSSPSSAVLEQAQETKKGEPFVLSDLRTITLEGRWHLSDSACDQLLDSIAPRLVQLILSDCKTHPSIQRLVHHGEKHPYLRRISVVDPSFYDEQALLAAGLDTAETDFEFPEELGSDLGDIYSLPSKAESTELSSGAHDLRETYCVYEINYDLYRYAPPDATRH